jgi:ribosomal protein S18 acetylase RimI-like enzyme
MPGIARRGIVAKRSLTERELAEVEELAALCNAREHLFMRLDHNLLALPTLPTDDLFLAYNGNLLIGCLLLDRYRLDIKEVTSMVHPDFRRQGIFTRLLEAARKECLSRGIHRLLLVCETNAKSGQAFVQAIGAGRDSAEHRMLLQTFQPRLQFDDHLLFREAVYDDLSDLATVLATDMGDDYEQAFAHVRQSWKRPNQCFYIATYGGEDAGRAEPVATLRIEETPVELGIYGFVVRPEYRGRGYGRQLLEEAIIAARARSQKPLLLEVDTNNFTALNLYQSVGFVIERTYEYYSLTLKE